MAGAAKCFFGFTGFDCIATTGEEAKNPQRNIPLAIIISLIIIFFAYFGISTVLTMMCPYYELNTEAPFPVLYEQFGWTEVKWVVSVGTIFALCTSLLGAMFPLPRILYAMGSDGIIYRFLSAVSQKTKTPLIATVLSGILAAIMATLFDIHQLIEMMSIGTLLAYTIVAISVLILRYQCPDENAGEKRGFYQIEWSSAFARQIFNLNGIKHADTLTSQISKLGILAFAVICTILCIVAQFLDDDFYARPLQLAVVVVLFAGMILSGCAVGRQPMVPASMFFKVPLVPLLPLISIFMNTYLMCQLEYQTWIRFAIWMFIGYFIYFSYGMRNSVSATPAAIQDKEKASEKVQVPESYKRRPIAY